MPAKPDLKPVEDGKPTCPTCGGEMETTEHLTLRGKHYTVHELLAEQYEDVVKRATPPPAEDGTQKDADFALLTKFLVLEAVKEDGKPIASPGKLPHPVFAKLNMVARRMHWGEIESDEEAEARERERKEREASGIPSR